MLLFFFSVYIKHLGVLCQMYKGGKGLCMGGYKTPGFTVPGTWYVIAWVR